jgi:hypothetical protein
MYRLDLTAKRVFIVVLKHRLLVLHFCKGIHTFFFVIDRHLVILGSGIFFVM